MTTFWSCHLIVNRKLPKDDHRRIRDLIGADSSHCGGISTSCLEWTPSTNVNMFSRYCAHFGKTLNISTANGSTSTVNNRNFLLIRISIVE